MMRTIIQELFKRCQNKWPSSVPSWYLVEEILSDIIYMEIQESKWLKCNNEAKFAAHSGLKDTHSPLSLTLSLFVLFSGSSDSFNMSQTGILIKSGPHSKYIVLYKKCIEDKIEHLKKKIFSTSCHDHLISSTDYVWKVQYQMYMFPYTLNWPIPPNLS